MKLNEQIKREQRYLEVLEWCDQRSKNIQQAKKETKDRIEQLLFEQETNELERSGAT